MSKASSNQQENTRTPFKIELEEHLPFNYIATTKYIPSNELAKAASDLFHGVFADYEGCMFEVPVNQPNMAPYFSLVFNHGDYDEGAITACELANGARSGKSDVLSRVRYRDAQLQNGDRYYLTEDGKDVVKSLLMPQLFNNNNPNWQRIVSEYSEGRQGFYGYNTPQYTKASYIDPNRLCALLYGDKDGEDMVEYHVSIFGPMNTYQGQQTANYMLAITKVSVSEINDAYNKLGLGSMSRIIK